MRNIFCCFLDFLFWRMGVVHETYCGYDGHEKYPWVSGFCVDIHRQDDITYDVVIFNQWGCSEECMKE